MSSKLPTINSYGEYSSDNYGAHCLCVQMPGITVWFSYKTAVAFQTDGKRVVRQNEWGPTTGKHLNWVDGGARDKRVSGEEFERLFAEATEPSDSVRGTRTYSEKGEGKSL